MLYVLHRGNETLKAELCCLAEGWCLLQHCARVVSVCICEKLLIAFGVQGMPTALVSSSFCFSCPCDTGDGT